MILYKCKGPRVSKKSSARKGCGASLDDLIAKVPVDGLDHRIVCPSCGNKSSVRRVPLEKIKAAAAKA